MRHVRIFGLVKPSPVSDPAGSSNLQTANDMNFTKSSDEYSTAVSNPTTDTNLKHCFHFTSAFFETGSSKVPYIVNASLNVLLALVTTALNTVLLSAIRKNTSLYLPSKLLLGSLALTDLGVGIVAQPMFVVFLVAKVKGFSTLSCFSYAILTIAGFIWTCVSLLTMTAISLDRYIALYFYLRYRDIVTTKRVFSVLLAIWLLAGLPASLWYWYPMPYRYFVIVVTSICFIVCTVSYTRIYRGLRHHHGNQATDEEQVQTPQQAANPLNVARYRRSAMNMLWIYGLFVLCYLPYLLTQIATQFVGRNALIQCLHEFAITVACFNSSLNPLLYCYRLREIRTSVLETLHEICGRSPQQ